MMGGMHMKRLFLVMAAAAVLTTNVFANVQDPRTALKIDDFKATRPVTTETREAPAHEFFTEPVSLIDNYYDYFPGSYTGAPMQRVQADIDGNWIVYHTKASASANRRVYKAFVDATGSVVSNIAFNTTDVWEGYPGVGVTEGGRPLLAYHVNLDDDSDLEIGFGYDAVIGGVTPGFHSELMQIVDNPTTITVDGAEVSTNEFIWPSVQIAASPQGEGYYRVYVMGKNATTNGGAVAENVYIVFKDFSEDDVAFQSFTNDGWQSTSIPQLDAWNNAPEEWRRPYMAFKAYEDKIFYVGYHIAYTNSDDGEPIEEPTTDVFVCDNYGEGTWEHNSIYTDIDSYNPRWIDPTTGEQAASGWGYFTEEPGDYSTSYSDDQLSIGIGQSGHFNVSFDNEGKLHFPAFFTLQTSTGSYYPALHVVKDISFDPNSSEWAVTDVYPNKGDAPFDFTDNTTGMNTNASPWLWWDQDGDGDVDEVLDDGTWDGIDDGVTAADTEYWGRPLLSTIWPFMYWDSEAADGAMMFHLHTAHITEANEEGMMAMVWQDAQKAQDYNNYPDIYPDYADHAQMCDIVISVSQDNGGSWSEPIVLNGVDTPEMQGEIPEFPYPGNKIDYIGEGEDGAKLGRLYLTYLDDDTYGSSVQSIGQATGGEMKYAAIDITFPASTPSASDEVSAPSMLSQNYPNPFNPTTNIAYNVAKAGKVSLEVYNVKGQLVKTLVNANQNVGGHTVVWNGDNNNGSKVSSGIYFYKLSNAGRNEMKKMVLMK
jgi:hypothetical protein